MRKHMRPMYDFLKIVVGCALFSLGFNLFLLPNQLNAGGLSGLAMALVRVLGYGSIGMLTILMNLPLFALAGLKIGKKFIVGSLIGAAVNSLLLDVFAMLPGIHTELLVAALYGGVICGAGLGIVFASGASTGGSDIVVRLLKLRYQNTNIGSISMCFDLCVVVFSAIVFGNITIALYSGIASFVTALVIDAVVYRFDYSKVALIISKEYKKITTEIERQLCRGATYLHGEGAYTHESTTVVLTAVKRQQVAELKRLVMEIDPAAFVIIQEAHQVLGDGFSKYSKDTL